MMEVDANTWLLAFTCLSKLFYRILRMKRLALSGFVAFGCSSAVVTAPDVASDAEAAQSSDVPVDVGELDVPVAIDTTPDDVVEPDLPDPPDTVIDVNDVQPPDVTQDPIPCAADEACGVRLDDDGYCAGACVPQDFGLHCDGTVSLGLFYTGDTPPKDVTIEGAEPGVTWTAPAIPYETAVGDTIELVLTGVDSGAARMLDVWGDWSPDWELVSSTVPNGTLTLPASATTELTVTLRALRPNVIEPWNYRIGTLYLGQNVVTAYGAILHDSLDVSVVARYQPDAARVSGGTTWTLCNL